MSHKSVTYHHTVLKGSAYKVGQMQGERVKAAPGFAAFMQSGQGAFSETEFRTVRDTFDRFCPGLNEEIQGLAEGLGVPPEHVVYYAQTYLRQGHCSHMAVLPGLTASGHVLLGRSYEFNDTMDDLQLCTTHVAGKYAHVGFSSLLLGRLDGLNEHGLAVTMSAGVLPVGTAPGLRPPIQDGLQFWALIRTVLETCRTVDEALDWIECVPCAGNPILIVADRDGHAALVEIFGPHHAVRRIDGDNSEGYVCAANHYTMPETRQQDPKMATHSYVRKTTIETRMAGVAPELTPETLKGILSDPYPKGVCCHYYGQGFGTLHSMVFDLTAGQVDVCFGSPVANDWHRFDLAKPAAAGKYPVTLPQEQAKEAFWAPARQIAEEQAHI